MAANGVVASRWMPESMKLEGGFGGYDAAKSDNDVHVLAVDDSHVDRKVIERLLKISSFKVTVVDSGTRALQILGLDGGEDSSSVAYNGLKVDLVITDYCMPGMTGYELLKKIKESSNFREVPVVIMSSENVMARINRCLEEGAEEFIMKPVKLSDVKRLRNYTAATRELGANVDREPGTKDAGGNDNNNNNNNSNLTTNNNKRKLMEPTDMLSESSVSPPSILSSPSSPEQSSASRSSSATCSPTSSLDSPTRRTKLTHPE